MVQPWEILRCPVCSHAPGPTPDVCAGCGRPLAGPLGTYDLLTYAERTAASAYAAASWPLRHREGWADSQGIEGPDRGGQSLWGPRLEAAGTVAGLVDAGLVLDVGAGGAWLADLLPGREVVAIDLKAPYPTASAQVRVLGDMRRLPVADASVDACVYCASLHHAPMEVALHEASRVLRPGGLLLVLESPFYRNASAAEAARERSRRYYRRAGTPELADAYFPIALDLLHAALPQAGLALERLDDPGPQRLRRLIGRPPRFPLLMARRARGPD